MGVRTFIGIFLMEKQRNIAVLLAGGSGRRMDMDMPKQLLKLGGKTVLEYSMDAFQSHPLIDEVMLVVNPDIRDEVRRILRKGHYDKVRRVLDGGKERSDSTSNALQALADFSDRKANTVNLIFHDAVRPLLSQRIIDDVCAALQSQQAVAVAVPCRDTIFEVRGTSIRAIPDRTSLMCAQTPQAFRLSVIRRAYEGAMRDPHFMATDDCGVVLRYLPEVKVHIVPGDDRNMKMTYRNDIAVMEALLEK